MRKVLFFLFFIFSFIQVNATHLMGGEITWQCVKDPLSPNVGDYIFTMKLYRDCDGITLSQFAQDVQVWENGVNIMNISCDFISNTDISPACDAVNSFPNAQLDCYGMNPAGAVEEYLYQSLPVQLIGTPPVSGWHFTWDECCRNDAITNLFDPGNAGFTLRASMYPYTDPATGLILPADPCFDSSPLFNESPKTIICAGYPFAYSHNASDPELDSIRYYWAEPLDDGFGSFDPDPANGSPAAVPFNAPYTFNAPLPGAPALNPISGEISYSAAVIQAGYYATVTRVEAYKCGQKIAEIHRDIQAVLIACPAMPGGAQNDPPEVPIPVGSQIWIDPSGGSSLLESYETTVTAGELVTFSITGIDTNLYNGVTPQDLTMEVSGGQILDPNSGTCANPPCATFTSTAGIPPPIIQPGVVEGVFEWQTSCDHVSTDIACGRTTNLYQFSIKVYDDFCPAPAIRNVTLMIYVEADNNMQVSLVQPTCFGNDGVITLAPSLSITQVAWDAEVFDLSGNLVAGSYAVPTNTESLSGLSYGQYVVRASGAGGCLVQDSVELLEAPNPLVMETNIGHVNCYGGSDGSIGVYLDNGLLPYTFYINDVENINPPPYDSLFTGLSEGVYIITVADSDSCGLVETIYIDAPDFPLQVLSSDSVVVCDTSLGGTAYAYAAGGSPQYDSVYVFTWYDSNWGIISDSAIITGLGIGDYFLEVTDSNGCQANIPITISTPELPLVLTPQLFGVVCTGDSTGSAIVFAGGGTAPYDFHWTNLTGSLLNATSTGIVTRDTVLGLSAGSYHLLVTDASGCTKEMVFNIDEPSVRLEIQEVLVVDSIDCYGDLEGRAIVNMVSGSGSPAYSYYWDNGEITEEALSLSGGWHTIMVSDSRGCLVVDSVDIPENTLISSVLDITTPISCYGYNDGVISVSTQAGYPFLTSPHYEYFWSNGVIGSDNITNLTHGSYYLTSRDALGCVVVDSIYLTEPDPLYVNAEEVLRVSCYGDSTGSAFAVGVGGTLPYTFTWQHNNIVELSANDSSIVNTQLFSVLETVSLEDARGCIATDTVMITQPDLLVVSISDSVLAYCVGVHTASATAVIVGGTAPYTYEWDDNNVVPQLTQTASNLEAGTYMVTVEDSRGCLANVSVDLDSVTSVMYAEIISLTDTFVTCYGSNDGELTVEVNSGFSPYTYEWFGPTGLQTNDSIFYLSAGIYSVAVTDNNGCVVNTSQQLTEPAPLLYKVVSTSSTSCLDACDGNLELYIEGGVGPYTADLLNNVTGVISSYAVDINDYVSNVCTGLYTVTIEDANGCDGTLMLGGSDQALLDTTITTYVSLSQQNILCYGDATGSISVVNPLSPPYSYSWQNINGIVVGTTSSVSNLPAGDYMLYSSYNGICTTVEHITLSQSALVHSDAVVTDPSCNGSSDGSVVTTTFGGAGGYTYSWSPVSSTTSDLMNLIAGVYELTITDANNCSVTEVYTIVDPALLVATVTASQTYILNASVVGGTPPYSYQWYSGTLISGATSDNYTVGANGTYYVFVTDANDCVSQSNSTTYQETPSSTIGLDREINLNVYPNPFREETTVDFGQIISKATITIVDVYGKLIEVHNLSNTDQYIIKGIDKASGVYFMEIELGQQVLHNIKLIIK